MIMSELKLNPNTEEAPRDGSMILGDFGYPCLLIAVWSEHDEQWSFAELHSQKVSGKEDPYFESCWLKHRELKSFITMDELQQKLGVK